MTIKQTIVITKNILLLCSLVLLFSCKKSEHFPKVENITKGSKWNLQIGRNMEEIYAALQELGREKDFASVALVRRTPYSKPEEIQHILGLYNTLTIQNTEGIIDRAIIYFDQNKISAIESGSALPLAISKWPQQLTDEAALQVGDAVNTVYNKLVSIHKMPLYSSYQFILPDKPLSKSFDTTMKNYTEWAFDFSTDLGNDKMGRNTVRLYFNQHQLVKIRNEYTENSIYN